MNKTILASLIVSLLAFALVSLPAAPVATTTSTFVISGQTISYNVAPTNSVPYYRLAYDSTTKKIVALVPASKGNTKSVYTLYCATTYAELQAFATTNALTGLPADPGAEH